MKAAIKTIIDSLLVSISSDSVKEQAVRRFGVASEIVKLGEADKKKAKADLLGLGIISGDEQNGVVFDSSRYQMTATTKAAASRLDPILLQEAMRKQGVSQNKINQIMTAATVYNKAAVSFNVEAK